MGVRHLLSFSYPNLRELTVRASCTPRQLASPRSGDVAPSQAPRLERLHLALPYHGLAEQGDNLQATHNLVHSISPAISHLRLTMLDKWGNKRVVEVLHAELAAATIVPRVLDLPSAPWDTGVRNSLTASAVTWDPLLPDGLKFFAIQPSPTSTFYCSCCMDHRGDVDVIRILECMSALANKDRFSYMDRRPITVRKCRTDPMEVAGYGYVEARNDWEERIQEGHGCWKQRNIIDSDDDDDATADGHRIRLPSILLIPELRMSRISKFRNAVKRLKMW
ncbi:hypothetical protein PsYK624_045290 [Phanerochaete sordida]|uniref:Uncharacterized protein n=1 Tax=Phanerochaete sordida TaxID=48140 RepID=A0A9P3G539_9APHY|nr:hypothetical protein PsYK624_045290 [Phanerochaete sordida]